MPRTSWLRTLHCKSSSFEDVCQPYKPSPAKKKLLSPLDCGNPSYALRDVVLLLPSKHSGEAPFPVNGNKKTSNGARGRPAAVVSPASSAGHAPSLPPPPMEVPALAEIPAGHSSRRVVEIIFESSWSQHGAPAPFAGEIELLFRVRHPPQAAARFEGCRAAARGRAGDARCAADGNEMMRFHAAPAACPSPPRCAAAYAWGKHGCGGGGVRTFAGSGGAHESVGGGAGRRAMLVCRVVAGRVRPVLGSVPDERFDSEAKPGGELVVLDPRAVLPCFLIIYKV